MNLDLTFMDWLCLLLATTGLLMFASCAMLLRTVDRMISGYRRDIKIQIRREELASRRADEGRSR